MSDLDVAKCFQCAENINPRDPGNWSRVILRGPEGEIGVEFHTRCWYEFDSEREHKPDSRAAQYKVLMREIDVAQH
jgi:hypothetical protein